MAEVERIWMRHEDGRTAQVGRASFEKVWRRKGWSETDPPTEDETLDAAAGTTGDGGVALEDLKKAELLDIADERGVDANDSMTKADIINALSDEAGAEEGGA